MRGSDTDSAIQRGGSVIGFPTPDPDGFIPARIEAAHSLQQTLIWSLDSLHSSPSRNAPVYEPHLHATVGSSYDWGDEMRFDCKTGLLSSVILATPEQGMINCDVARSWLALPRRAGLPAVDREIGFNIDPLDLRFLSEDVRHLIALDSLTDKPPPNAVRLTVQSHFDLLFADGRYCGWMLHDPISYLGNYHEEGLISAADDPELAGLLRDYHHIVIQPNIDKMDDKDPQLRAMLQALLDRAQACMKEGSASRALANRLAGLLEIFYG